MAAWTDRALRAARVCVADLGFSRGRQRAAGRWSGLRGRRLQTSAPLGRATPAPTSARGRPHPAGPLGAWPSRRWQWPPVGPGRARCPPAEPYRLRTPSPARFAGPGGRGRHGHQHPARPDPGQAGRRAVGAGDRDRPPAAPRVRGPRRHVPEVRPDRRQLREPVRCRGGGRVPLAASTPARWCPSTRCRPSSSGPPGTDRPRLRRHRPRADRPGVARRRAPGPAARRARRRGQGAAPGHRRPHRRRPPADAPAARHRSPG